MFVLSSSWNNVPNIVAGKCVFTCIMSGLSKDIKDLLCFYFYFYGFQIIKKMLK